MAALHPVVERVTARIAERSRKLRDDYLARMDAARESRPARRDLGCGNLAHGFAAAGADKSMLKTGAGGNLGIVTAYNDMLSAHQPMEQYPALIRMAARNAGGSAQVEPTFAIAQLAGLGRGASCDRRILRPCGRRQCKSHDRE